MTCKYGHEAPRSKNGTCTECTRLAARKWHQDHPDASRAMHSRWRKQNPDMVAAQRERRRQNNAVSAWTAKRRAALMQRTPSWADIEQIKIVYDRAEQMRASGVEVDVDHVYPLQGELVSGLHVHENLMIIPSAENAKKHNRVPPELLEWQLCRHI